MKTRIGFVSNSSTSSFCIYGAYVTPSTLKKHFIETNLITEEECNNYKDIEITDWLYELLNGAEFKQFDLQIEQVNNNDEIYIGRSWKKINDDQTGLEFKESIVKSIGKVLGTGIECTTHEEGWYDG